MLHTTIAAPLHGGTPWHEDPPEPKQDVTLDDWLQAADQCADIEEALRAEANAGTFADDTTVAELRQEWREWRAERNRIAGILGM